MKVTLCSSSRYYKTAREVAFKLQAEGAEVMTPSFVHNETVVPVDAATKAKLTQRFFKFIQQTDCLYVIAEDGYIGISVALEIGYASALNKPIFLSEKADDHAIQSLAKAIITTDKASVSLFAKNLS